MKTVTLPRMPAAVKVWYDDHRRDKIAPYYCLIRAVNRAYGAGDISERTADRLEKAAQDLPKE